MTDTVKESAPAAFFYFCGVPLVTKPVSKFILNFLAVGRNAGLRKHPLLPLIYGSSKMTKGFRGLSFHDGSGDIPKVAG